MKSFNHYRARRTLLQPMLARLVLLGACGAAGLSLSCVRPGYRNEVYPGAQGQYTIKQVPITNDTPSASPETPPQPASPPPASAPPPAPVAVSPSPAMPPSDAGLETIRGLWPQLSPSDRAAVVDMTKHLAAPRP